MSGRLKYDKSRCWTPTKKANMTWDGALQQAINTPGEQEIYRCPCNAFHIRGHEKRQQQRRGRPEPKNALYGQCLGVV